MRSLLLGAVSLALLAQTASKYELPADQRTGSIKRIMVLPHAHLDIGFTLPPDQVARDYKDSIDEAIRLVRTNPDLKWTIESTWMLGEWLRRTTDEKLIDELGRYLREGRMSLAAGFANMHSGLVGDEEMNRLVYLAEAFRKRFRIPVELAIQNDVPGFSWAYPRVFAGSGVRYLITGLNLFIGGGNNFGVRNTPFYWIGPDGSRVLTFFTYDSYVEGHRWNLTGSVPFAEFEKTVPRRLAWLEHNGYLYDAYLLMASVGDNADPRHVLEMLSKIREWNRKHPELPMQMCNAEEYFRYITGKYGDQFKVFSGDATGHWELVKLGAPEVASRMRETASLLPAVEAVHAIVSVLHGSQPPVYDLAEAWRELLVFHEHTAGAGPGWPGYYTRWQTDWSNAAHYAAAMGGYSNTRQLMDKGLARLTGSTGIFDPAQKASADGLTLLVYNGLSWPRGGPVEIGILPAALRQGQLEVVDKATGDVRPTEVVPGTSRRIFFAPEIPAMGYRLFNIRRSTNPQYPPGDFSINIQTDDQGWIRSIRSRSGEEMIPKSARTFGSLLFANRNRNFEEAEAGAPRKTGWHGVLSRRVEIVRENSPLRRTTATVYQGAPWVDLAFDVDLAAFGNLSGRIAISLPFNTNEQLWLDGAGFTYRVPQDMLPGGSAAQFTAVSFAHSSEPGRPGLTVGSRDAALLLRDGTWLVASHGLRTETRDEGVQYLARTEPRGSDIQTFRFRLATQGTRPAEWKRFGHEFNLPLQSCLLNAADVPIEQSFLSADHPNVVISAFKAAEADPGRFVIRLQEIGGEGADKVRISSAFRITDAVYANTVEQPGSERADLTNISLKPWQTVTILAHTGRLTPVN